MTLIERLEGVLGSEDDWERPGPTRRERVSDRWLAVGFFVLAALGSELLRSIGAFADNSVGAAGQYLGIGTAAAILIWRRSHPVAVAVAATVHLLVVGSLMPPVVSSLPMQVLYFFAIYSGVAWAKDRRVTAYVVLGVVVAIFAWVAWFLALSSGMAELYGNATQDGQGPIPAIIGVAGWIILNNVMYFGGAVLLGQVAWRGALRSAQVAEQAHTITAQGKRLRDQAVVAERLRIARELHDVVAHHISVMGVQAAAARRVLATDEASAAESLHAIEGSSRSAVAQMRDLLGTLRTGEAEAHQVEPGETGDHHVPSDAVEDQGTAIAGERTSEPDRSPQPGLGDLPTLIAEADSAICRVGLQMVPDDWDQGNGFEQVAAPVQLSVYRIAQEALANVRRHSTARSAHVAVRVEPHVNRVEVEVVDGGVARTGTAGTGLGQLGMAERARHLGGGLEIGARRGGGYRVRAWFPMDGTTDRRGSRVAHE